MAKDTGGRSFLRGESAKKVVAQLQADRGATYLLSFSPDGFPTDQPLALSVVAHVSGVSLRTQGRITVPSTSTRIGNQILSAFVNPDQPASSAGIQVGLVPLSFQDGGYRVLSQVRVRPSPLGGTWDLGASLVRRGKVETQSSGRIAVTGGGLPVVLEEELVLSPGEYQWIAVARDQAAGDLLSTSGQGNWPDPDDAEVAVVSPTAIMQPIVAVFSRQGAVRRQGSLVYGTVSPHPVQETAFVTVVCRGESREPLTLERALVGEAEYRFAPALELPRDESCVQLRDMVPAGYLDVGRFRYRVTVLERGAARVSTDHPFLVQAGP
jgi:hypothetical protein